jgi:ferric-dicitrate binding protein FerR (iron transport regulator)
VASKHRIGLVGVAVIAVGATALGVLAVRAHLMPKPRALRLADGTEAFFLSSAHVEPASSYPEPREIRVNGEAFIRASASEHPLIVRSRLLVLTVTGRSAFRITADAKSTGEEVDVLEGQVRAKKAYPSPQSEPDDLVGGQIVMLNETIDLQEKESGDLPGLRAWSDALMASAAGGRKP